MARNFEFDISAFQRAIARTPELVGRGAMVAMGDIKDDWTREARDMAPIDPSGGGNLRRQIQGEVNGEGIAGEIEMTANASQADKGGTNRFNYAYYIHEHDAGGKGLRSPGAVKKFLDESGEKRQDEWKRWLEDDIKQAVRRAGW